MSLHRRLSRTIAVGLVAGALAITSQPAQAASVSEGFDNVAQLTTWKTVNLSQPGQPEKPSWMQGDPTEFTAQAGAENSYMGIEYTSGGENVSNWLIMPQQTSLSSTDVLNFWTRSAGSSYPDRLEVRMSSNGACNPGTTTDGVGDFTTLLTSINPNQLVDGYPEAWTQVNLPLTGLSTTNVSGCIAFRYYIHNTDNAGQYIGIDSLTFTDNASPACTTAQASATSAQAQVATATTTVATTTKAVTTAKKVLKKAKKKLKKATKAGDDTKIEKAKKNVKKAKKKVKKATKKNAAAKTALTTAQTALTAAQTASTSSCP
ncbi:hypothetical protein GCM10023339_34320 [Alloalcanivorax gelatiniphagus]